MENERDEELSIICINEVCGGRETNESTERGGVQIRKVRAQNGALWHSESERFRRREMKWDGNG